MKRTILLAMFVGLASLLSPLQVASARNRDYSPAIGRFIQRDLAGERAGAPMSRSLSDPLYTQRDPTGQYSDGMGLYQYVGSRPATSLDPSGLYYIDYNETGLAKGQVWYNGSWYNDVKVPLYIGSWTTMCGGGYLVKAAEYGSKYNYIFKKEHIDGAAQGFLLSWPPAFTKREALVKFIIQNNMYKQDIGYVCASGGQPTCNTSMPTDDTEWHVVARANIAIPIMGAGGATAYEGVFAGYATVGAAATAAIRAPLNQVTVTAGGSSSIASNTAYRYVGEAEASLARATGFVPNTKVGSEVLKPVFYTPNYYSSSIEAMMPLQLDKAATYTYRIAVNATQASPSYAGNVLILNGTAEARMATNAIEWTTYKMLPVKSITPLSP